MYTCPWNVRGVFFGGKMGSAERKPDKRQDSQKEILADAFASQPIREVITTEAVAMYRDSLRDLGCSDEDINRSVANLTNGRIHLRNVQAVYNARRAADAIKVRSIHDEIRTE